MEKEIFVLRSLEIGKNNIDKNQFSKIKKNIKKKTIVNHIDNFNKFRATCWNFIIKTSFLRSNNINFKNIRVFEDQYFVSKILCLSKSYKIISKPVYLKRLHDPNTLSSYTGYTIVKSCIINANEIAKFIFKDKNILNNQKINFLLSRLKFVVILSC